MKRHQLWLQAAVGSYVDLRSRTSQVTYLAGDYSDYICGRMYFTALFIKVVSGVELDEDQPSSDFHFTFVPGFRHL